MRTLFENIYEKDMTVRERVMWYFRRSLWLASHRRWVRNDDAWQKRFADDNAEYRERMRVAMIEAATVRGG